MYPKHLHRYVDGFAGRLNNRFCDTIDVMKSVAKNTVGKRLTYSRLVDHSTIGSLSVQVSAASRRRGNATDGGSRRLFLCTHTRYRCFRYQQLICASLATSFGARFTQICITNSTNITWICRLFTQMDNSQCILEYVNKDALAYIIPIRIGVACI